MDFINAPVGLPTLVCGRGHYANKVLGKGLPITEQLRPLIASQALVIRSQ